MNFDKLNLRKEILRAISELGYENATTIQSESIPFILSGQDVTGRSSTGTGKTAAFGLPIVQRVSEETERSSVLILAPTRELAIQITGELRKYAKYLPDIGVACLYGGQPMNIQIRALKKAPIVVGTPGRVMDHIRRKTLKLENLKTVVLDEADEMLNMGFIDDIRTILESAPKDRQTILFSATLSPEILNITKEFQNNTAFIQTVKKQKTADQIDQSFYYIPADRKTDALALLLEDLSPKRSLIFCNTKKGVDELAERLSQRGYSVIAIHGDLNQGQRTQVMKDFKSGRRKHLIATDVAARGIDVDDVEAVYNYDVPQELEAYVHRIGRTGRAGNKGSSFTLVAGKGELRQLKRIEEYIHTAIREEQLPSIAQIQKHQMAHTLGELRQLAAEEVPAQWLSMVEELEKEGVSISHIAAALCGKVYKTSRRMNTITEVACLSTQGAYGENRKERSSGRRDERYGERRKKNPGKNHEKNHEHSRFGHRDTERDPFSARHRGFKIRTKK